VTLVDLHCGLRFLSWAELGSNGYEFASRRRRMSPVDHLYDKIVIAAGRVVFYAESWF
jgi:hypothetical protein